MVIAYIPLIYFTLLFINRWRKYRRMNSGSIVVIFYIFSSLFSLLYLNRFEDSTFISAGFDNLLPTFLYCALLTIAILPVYDFRSDLLEQVYLDPKKELLYEIICWVLIALSVISIISSFDSIVSALHSNLGSLRTAFYQTNAEYSYTRASQPLYKYLLSFGTSMSPIMLLFFFYGTIYRKHKKLLNIALLVASLSQVLLGMALASRNQLIYWVMTAIALYFTFRQQMDIKTRRVYRILAIVLGALGILYFVAVTVSRFQSGTTSFGGVQTSLIAYVGLPYPQFCKLFNLYTFDGVSLDRTFPIFTKYILMHDFNLYEFRHNVSLKIGMDVGTFFTFLGDAMIDFGKIGMIIYAFLFGAIERIAYKRNNVESISLTKMIIYVLLLRVPLLGLFAYVYLSISTSLTIIGSIIIIAILNSRYVLVIKRKS